MFKKLFLKKMKDEKGAMDKVIVTLLLVVVGVAAVVGLSSWMATESESVKTSASGKIATVIAEPAE